MPRFSSPTGRRGSPAAPPPPHGAPVHRRALAPSLVAACVLGATLLGASTVSAEELMEVDERLKPHQGLIARGSGGFSFLSEQFRGGPLISNVSYGAELGWRFSTRLDLTLSLEHNFWPSSEASDEGDVAQVINWGVGIALLYFDGNVRSSLIAGGSTMLFETPLDEVGDTGVFFDFRPVTYRFRSPIGTVEVAPLALEVMAPTLSGIPLIEIVYRTVVTMEWTL